MDWQISLALEKTLCDLRPLNECFESPKPGFWHHIAHIANWYSLSDVMPVSLTDSGSLLVYPNPFSSVLSIQSNIETTATIYDLNGSVIYNVMLQKGKNQASVAFLPPGFYIIRTASGKSHKLVKVQ